MGVLYSNRTPTDNESFILIKHLGVRFERKIIFLGVVFEVGVLIKGGVLIEKKSLEYSAQALFLRKTVVVISIYKHHLL
jgi:hypothetical protein